MEDQIVIAGPTSQRLALKVAELLHARVVTTENKIFPDGECYLRIDLEDDDEFKGKDIIIVQTMGANSSGDQNLHIMELIMMIGAVKRMKASKIRIVVPYFAYSRQDKAFRTGECIFAEEILKWIEMAGATELRRRFIAGISGASEKRHTDGLRSARGAAAAKRMEPGQCRQRFLL